MYTNVLTLNIPYGVTRLLSKMVYHMYSSFPVYIFAKCTKVNIMQLFILVWGKG